MGYIANAGKMKSANKHYFAKAFPFSRKHWLESSRDPQTVCGGHRIGVEVSRRLALRQSRWYSKTAASIAALSGACPFFTIGVPPVFPGQSLPDAFSSPNSFPGDFFNQATGNPAGRIRGALLQTTGTFEVSANAASGTATLFGNRNPENAADFAAFSQERIFGLNGTNEMDVLFRIPGEPDAVASVRGFGAVFTDVEVDGLTTLDFFGLDGSLLESVDVPAFPIPSATADSFKSFSFLGVLFDSAAVGRVHITNGDTDLSVGPNALDAVAMDDFIYGEPKLAPRDVPETGHGVFLLGGVVGILGWMRHRRLAHREISGQ